MTSKSNDDILSILDEVHGDTLSRREATVDGAVTSIEKGALRAYSALKDLSQNGTPAPAAMTAAAMAMAEAASEPEEVVVQEVVTLEPEKPRTPGTIAVISGVGAEFKDPGGTKTFIIRRPKAPSGR